MIFGYFTLFVALIISTVAAYYSIVGLTAIFSAAVIPIIIMGAALEVGKVTAAVWLKLNWHRARLTYKLYLVPAVAFLMLLTSMGIFGFLSKAHTDQNLVSGDVIARIAVYDEKIKTEKDNIDANRKALKQLDEAVDQVMGRSTDERGAERAVQIRRSQQAERGRLFKEIEQSQKRITALNEQRAPIAAEVRKVEAEVGPIKYIASMVYGDNPDASLLEAAVRWVIILIVLVFDPLALVLILAAQQSIRWAKENKLEEKEEQPAEQPPAEQPEVPVEEVSMVEEKSPAEHHPDTHPYLRQGFRYPKDMERVGPMVAKNEDLAKQELEAADLSEPRPIAEFPELQKLVKQGLENGTLEIKGAQEEVKIELPKVPYYSDLGNGYFDVEGKTVHSRVIKDLYPEVYADIERKKLEVELGLKADNNKTNEIKSKASFGIQFPDNPTKGDMFLHVGTLPSRLFKHNGNNWIQVDKSIADSYTYDEDYLNYLVDKISKGIISTEDLTDSEQDQIENHLKKNV